MAALRKYFPHLVLALGAFVMLLPFYWMVLTSIRSPAEIFDVSLWPIPQKFDAVDNYARAAGQVPMARFMLNGVIVCVGILVVQVLTSVPAAYALAKLRFPGRKLLLGLVIAALCVPIQALALPLFVGLAKTELLNTYFAMMMPFFLSVFAIFLFNQSFRSYPNEIIEAARMDGFSEMEICWGLVLRGSLPSLAAFSIFSLVAHWNDLYWPMIVVSDTNLAPPPLGMMLFADVESGANYGALMAGATLITAPMVLCFLLARRHFIAGITMTGVK
ncbi:MULTISPECIES: carbohydrate ABC transporter permease [Agrobacterium]|jgi:multiple sugar transport system permease protein|uniref:Carbohydrate ABC transporter permease n=3 Tax=Agrobacterium tumefaciens TaxID=358 RepID=A0AAP4YKT3_AGRTU|nr:MULTISPECIES: carbohydrate ABC transporter permease [Agrobacterium]AYM04310.1 multiple sugar transport system permease protein [Agrobacterium tumefaciens]AYM79955.1 multiple sugar transport system permease protein [Agrobacterium tumefaciens]EHH08183.1 ABC transporter, membrane spanning protein [Agrobacterium tumefaciens CCNWGS0286]KWT88848.1 sugar ABC transporter permease [Agrobacterium tumefaciens str. B6]MBB4404732.1 multiple sugar transport system permease protein [Agrobacterium radiobac